MKQEQVYPVTIEVHAFDRSGLLRDLSGVVAEENVNMSPVNSRSRRDNTALVTRNPASPEMPINCRYILKQDRTAAERVGRQASIRLKPLRGSTPCP